MEYVKKPLNLQELLANATVDTLDECKGLVERNRGGKYAQARVKNIACHLIPNLYELSENSTFTTELYNHLVEKFTVAYAKEFNEEFGGQLRIANGRFYDAVDGAVKLKKSAEQNEALQREKANVASQTRLGFRLLV